MTGFWPQGAYPAGTLELAGNDTSFLDFIRDPIAVGVYTLEIGLTPINIEFNTPKPPTHGTFAGGTRSLARYGDAIPLGAGAKLLFSDREFCTRPDDRIRPNIWSHVRITDRADIERSLAGVGTGASAAQVTLGEIELADGDGFIRDVLRSYTVKGQVAEVRYQPQNGPWSSGRRIWRGIVSGATRTSGVVRISFRDISSSLAKPLSLYRYAGSGLSDGYAALAGTYRPLVIGRVRNIDPPLEDQGKYIYRFSNLGHQEVEEVTVSGLALEKAGVHAGDYASLRLLEMEEGTWIDAPALGVFRAEFAGGSPGGEVRCTGRGDTSYDGYVSRLPGAALRVVDYCSLDRSFVDVSSFSALPDYKIGYYFPGGAEPPTGEDILKKLLRPVLGVYGSLQDERFSVGVLSPPEETAHSAEFVEEQILSVDEVGTEFPHLYRQRMIYDLNWAPNNESELGAGLTASEKNYLTIGHPPPAEAARGNALLQNRDAEEGPLIETYLTEEADAIACCATYISFFGPTRRPFEVTVPREGLTIDQATVWRGAHPDLPGGSESSAGTVLQRRDDYAEGKVVLTVYI